MHCSSLSGCAILPVEDNPGLYFSAILSTYGGGMIRIARSDDVARIREIAREAYARYVPRIGRGPTPMVADYEGDMCAGRVVVLEVERNVIGYLVAWQENDAYFIENIGIEPHHRAKAGVAA